MLARQDANPGAGTGGDPYATYQNSGTPADGVAVSVELTLRHEPGMP